MVSQLWDWFVACLVLSSSPSEQDMLSPLQAGRSPGEAGRAPPGTRSAGPLGTRRSIHSSSSFEVDVSFALFTRQPLGQARDLSVEQLRQNQPRAPWLLP